MKIEYIARQALIQLATTANLEIVLDKKNLGLWLENYRTLANYEIHLDDYNGFVNYWNNALTHSDKLFSIQLIDLIKSKGLNTQGTIVLSVLIVPAVFIFADVYSSRVIEVKKEEKSNTLVVRNDYVMKGIDFKNLLILTRKYYPTNQ